MTDKGATLRVLPTEAVQRNDATIARAQELLADVVSGHVTAFIAVAFHPDRSFKAIIPPGHDALGVIGTLEVLKRDLIETITVK